MNFIAHYTKLIDVALFGGGGLILLAEVKISFCAIVLAIRTFFNNFVLLKSRMKSLCLPLYIIR